MNAPILAPTIEHNHPDAVLFVQGQPLTPDRRAALKHQLKEGTLTELEFQAAVYRTGPNRNHVLFPPDELVAFAASFTGQPFLRNHDTADIAARDGTIVHSHLVTAGACATQNAGGEWVDEFHQTIRLTTERGLRDFLDGIMDRFSIAWDYDAIHCSICHADWFACSHYPGRTYPISPGPLGAAEGQGATRQTCELIFIHPVGKETSAVNTPAVRGTRILDTLTSLKDHQLSQEPHPMTKPNSLLPTDEIETVQATPALLDAAEAPAATAPPPVEDARSPLPPTAYSPSPTPQLTALLQEVRALQAQLDARRFDEQLASSGLSPASQAAVRLAAHDHTDPTFTAQLLEAQRQAEASAVERQVVRGIRPILDSMMTTPHDRVQSALSWLFGVRDELVPPPSLRSIRDLYQAVTGDHNWYGVYAPEWAQLSGNTTTLAGMVVNALNKIIRQHYDNLATYRWYETLVDVVPHDGSTHQIELVFVDGLANLPVVGEGAAYTEAAVGDSKESFTFSKRGHYVGITLEAIRRSDIQRIQAIPREMVKASIRTRSAAIAGIFTASAGAGPTLADDSKALFHADHGNLDTTAFSAAAWPAARQRVWSQLVPGTSAPLGLWPTYCLVPIELYDTALEAFGYGSGDVGKPNSAGTAQTVNPYAESRLADPRPIPIAVPEWTDATDWAYLVDPRLHPVLCMAYANAPQGGQHPLPEIFEVTSETSGLLFTNDTLPVKIRDWWGYGVATHVGIGKNNVAG